MLADLFRNYRQYYLLYVEPHTWLERNTNKLRIVTTLDVFLTDH